MISHVRLGVNIDHVATLRNARGGAHPCPVRAALEAKRAGADGITAHLREDRRHIRDADMHRLKNEVALPLNFEMAATEEMLALALHIQPHAVCLVPEKREELTTEGGLDVVKNADWLRECTGRLQEKNIRVSHFIDASPAQIEAAKACHADIIELHTGTYAENPALLPSLQAAAVRAHAMGLEVHAGHGLTFTNVAAIAAIPEIMELNIGHFLIAEAVFSGLYEAVRTMRRIINEARV